MIVGAGSERRGLYIERGVRVEAFPGSLRAGGSAGIISEEGLVVDKCVAVFLTQPFATIRKKEVFLFLFFIHTFSTAVSA